MSLMSNCRWTDIRSLMNNFIKDFISLKIDHMQQGVHVTAQSSITYKDIRSYMGKYKAESSNGMSRRLSSPLNNKLLFLTSHLKITYFRAT